MQDSNMQGSRLGATPPPSRTHGTGRTCETPGCDTKLSMYNPASHCWQHAEIVFPVYRGKRLTSGAA